MTQPPTTLTVVADLSGPYGTHLAFDAASGRWALGDDRTIQLGRDGHLERKLTAPAAIEALAWSADGSQLLAGAQRYDLLHGSWQPHALELANGLEEPPPLDQLGVAACAYAPDGQELVVAARFQASRGLDAPDRYRGPGERLLVFGADRAPRGVLAAGDAELRAIAVSDHLIAAGGAVVTLWDRQSLREVAKLTPAEHALTARALAFNAAGDRLAVLDASGAVTLWDTASQQRLTSFAAHQGDGYAIAFHPQRPLLATGGMDSKLRLWSLTGELVHDAALTGWVEALAFAPDGSRLAAVARARPPHLVIFAIQ